MQFYATAYLKIVPYLSGNILGLRDIERHMGNYICALQEKEKYHKTHQPMKGKVGGAERIRRRDKNVKGENYGLYLI